MSRPILFLLLAATAAVARDKPTPAAAQAKPERAVVRVAELKLALDGTEDPQPGNLFGAKKINLRELLQIIEQAAADPDIAAIELNPVRYGVGVARLLEVRAKLAELRKAGKKVFFYRESLSTADMILASAADRISVPESGMVVMPGIAIESLYMRELLAKLKIRFDVIHIGDYKTAGESMVRDSMSKELKESLDPILDEMYGSFVTAIAQGRGISEEKVRAGIDKGLMTARQAKELGLIDRVEYRDEFAAGVRAFFPGKKVVRVKDYGRTGSKLDIDPQNPLAAFSLVMGALFGGDQEPRVEGPKIAVIYCSGVIVSGKSQYDWQGNIAAMGSKTIVKAIDRAARDADTKAIVLRINSPGGSGLASDMIWRAIETAKAKKKVVVASMGDVAASGGYYIAMNSDVIVAEPQTVTGSIGVVGMVPNIDRLYTWAGITPERLTRGKHAGALMTTKGLGEADIAMLKSLMGDFYKDFVTKVALGRSKTFEEIDPIAGGRVWTGRKAKALGLVDELGGLQKAIAIARKRAGFADTDKVHIVESPRRAGPFEFLQEMFEARLGLDQIAIKQFPGLERVLWRIQTMRRVGQDRICCVSPELMDLAAPFTKDIR